MSLEADIAATVKQENALQFAKFDEADAWKLGCQMREAAASAKLPFLIEIRMAGRQLFVSALPGTSPDNVDWVRRKANSVMRFHKSTYRLGREGELRNSPFDASRGIEVADFANHGGGFPIHIKGVGVVGAVVVSGVPQRQDHEFAVEQIAIFLGLDPAPLKLAAE